VAQRKGHSNVSTNPRGRASTDSGRGGHNVPRRSQDGHALGESRKTHVDPNAWWPQALPGDGGPCSARGYTAAALGVAPTSTALGLIEAPARGTMALRASHHRSAGASLYIFVFKFVCQGLFSVNGSLR